MNITWKKGLLAIGVYIVVALIGTVLSFMLLALFNEGDFMEMAANGQANLFSSLSDIQFKFFLLLNQLFYFLIPGILAARILFGDWLKETRLANPGEIWDYILGFLFLLAALPPILYLNYLALDLPWPELFRNGDSQVYAMMERLFDGEGILSILGNILIIGILAALGEELVFRGLLQNGLMRFINPHLAIAIIAFVFGFIHFQADGMIARILLGAILGYAYYISSSLWVPIAIHCIYNSVQVLMVELGAEEFDFNESAVTDPGIHPLLVLGSAIFCLGIWYYWRKIKEYA